LSLAIGHASHANLETLGIVILARSANLGNSAASAGMSLYDGDRLATDANGSLSVRSGMSMLYLGSQSSAMLRKVAGQPPGTQLELNTGTLVFSIPQKATTLVAADGASIRPASDILSLGQIRILTKSKFEIFARRGALKVLYGGETETIPEGKSYRVELAVPEDNSTPISLKSPPRHAKKRKLIALFSIAGIIAAAASVPLMKDYESPDCPQTEQCSK
jgi:hypothetical protein